MKAEIMAVVQGIRDLMETIGRPVRLMEVCGTHTVAIFKHGIRNLLPEGIQLLSGPGCPVCVTSVRDVDTVIAMARLEGVTVATFGDMMRVPGNRISLSQAKAEGTDVRVVYSPLDALKLAAELPKRRVVFFGTGFETTSPLVAGTVLEAEKKRIGNFLLYSVHKTVPPAMRALLDSGEVRVDGFILPGHVSTIIGLRPYGVLASVYGKPSVVTGFDSLDILTAILMLLRQVRKGVALVENQYSRVVKEDGNPRAVEVMDEVFEPSDAVWRGIGQIPGSGLALREKYRGRDAMHVFTLSVEEGEEPRGCSCGEVLKGVKIPPDCRLFGKACTPERPIGACMVSSEGSCAAYYKYSAVHPS